MRAECKHLQPEVKPFAATTLTFESFDSSLIMSVMNLFTRIPRLVALLTLIVAYMSPLSAQINEDDPLRTARKLIQEEEILLTYTEISSNSSSTASIHGRGYNPNAAGTALPLIRSTISNNVAGNIPVLNGATATVAGNFLGDDIGEGVARAFIGKNGSSNGVYFMIEFFEIFDNTTSHLAANTDVFYVGDVFTPGTGKQQPDVDLVAGNFDTDPQEELAVIYTASDNSVKAVIYDIAIDQLVGSYITVLPTEKARVYAGPTEYSSKVMKGIAGAEVDINSDGIDELAVIINQSGGNSIRFTVFERKATGTFDIRGNPITLFTLNTACSPGSSFNHSNLSLDIASGEMNDQLPGEELVVVAHFGLTGGVGSAGNNQGLYVFPLGSVIYPNTGYQSFYTTWCQGGSPFYFTSDEFLMSDEEIAIDVETGDLDGDLDAEVVVGTSSKVFIFDAQTNNSADGVKYMTFNQLSTFGLTSAYTNNQIGGEARFADDFLDVGNIDALTGNFGSEFRAEILIGKNFPLISDPINQDLSQKFELTVYGFNETGGQGSVDFSNAVIRKQETNIVPVTNGQKTRHFSAIFADVDGGSVRLGTPTRTDISEVLNPSIILNAPPTHFDVLGNTSYDVSNLYATGEPTPDATVDHYYSNYEQINSQTSSFSTSFTADWAVSAEVKAGLDLSGFSLGARMKQTYGERFSSIYESETEQTIVQSRTAFTDDELLAYLVDYAVYEYPVYRQGEVEEYSHVVVVLPTDIKETFIGARNPIHSYRPAHQHGNLFSYPTDVSELDVFPTANAIYTDQLKSQSINKTSGFNTTFSVTQSDATSQMVETEITTETMVGANAGGAFKGVGLSVDVEGNYNTSAIQNSSLKYRQEVTMSCYLGQGEQATIPGDYPYTITPLVYWGAEGALILDYLVDINKFEFWQNNYNSYDPAFLLLNPHKVEKGIEADSTYNSSDRFRTRDIYFSSRPTPGDTVEIFAKVFNYGFIEIPTNTVDVAFYYNDPTGLDTLVHIATERISFGFQGRDDGLGQNLISTSWAIPGDLGPDTKVVAIIDPDNTLTAEIHDYPNGNGVSNNIGWTCAFVPNCTVPTTQNMFFPDGVTTIEEFSTTTVAAFPNPFDHILQLEMNLESADELTIEVFTLQGQRVFTQTGMTYPRGNHRLSIATDSWAEGLYFYQVSGQTGQTMGKVVLRR